MTKVIRINNETLELLEEYRGLLNRNFENMTIKLASNIINNDNLVIQNALRSAIWSEHLIEKKSK